jgi:hypothetical protein
MEFDSFESSSLLGLSAVSSSDTEVAPAENSTSTNGTESKSAAAKKKKLVKNTSEFELDTQSNRTIMRNEWLFN